MRKIFFQKIVLILLSSFLIFYKFNQIPKNLAFDEVEFAKLALSLAKKPYTPYSNLATGHSTLYFYIILLSFKIFGVNRFGLRFPAALFGVLNVLLFYLILRLTINKRFSFFLSLVFLTSRWYFNFARFSFEATFLLFLELLSVYYFFQFLKKETKIDLILSGFFAGLAFNSYLPGRIFFLLPLGFLVLRLIRRRNSKNLHQLILFTLIFILLIFPLGSYLFGHPDVRFQQLFFPANSQESFQRKTEFLLTNVKKVILMFNIKGDVNGRHNYPEKPALNPILGLFFVVGFFLSLKNYRNFYHQFFLFYFFISLLPSLLVYPWENPNMLRTFTVIPSVVFFVGCTVEFLLADLKMGRKYKNYLVFFVFLLLVLSSIYEIRTYFKYQAKVFEDAFKVKGELKRQLF